VSSRGRRAFVSAASLAAVAMLVGASPSAAYAEVPVRVRVIKGSRQGPARIDPKLNDLRHQLSPLAYVSWEQVAEQHYELDRGKPQFVDLPSGDTVGVTLQERRGDTVTIEVALASRNTQSRLTVEKGQRIVHQVTAEKGGSAFFLTVMAWPPGR
jgi:FtsP/CotA-like multicopper oxidase with cupredoxin domain